jgi:hypothetical protein
MRFNSVLLRWVFAVHPKHVCNDDPNLGKYHMKERIKHTFLSLISAKNSRISQNPGAHDIP